MLLAPISAPRHQGTGVSLATLSASHLTPWREMLIFCAGTGAAAAVHLE